MRPGPDRGHRMRKTILGLAAAAAMMLAGPRGAQACGRGGADYGGFAKLAAVTLSVDAAFTLWDAGSLLQKPFSFGSFSSSSGPPSGPSQCLPALTACSVRRITGVYSPPSEAM